MTGKIRAPVREDVALEFSVATLELDDDGGRGEPCGNEPGADREPSGERSLTFSLLECGIVLLPRAVATVVGDLVGVGVHGVVDPRRLDRLGDADRASREAAHAEHDRDLRVRLEGLLHDGRLGQRRADRDGFVHGDDERRRGAREERVRGQHALVGQVRRPARRERRGDLAVADGHLRQAPTLREERDDVADEAVRFVHRAALARAQHPARPARLALERGRVRAHEREARDGALRRGVDDDVDVLGVRGEELLHFARGEARALEIVRPHVARQQPGLAEVVPDAQSDPDEDDALHLRQTADDARDLRLARARGAEEGDVRHVLPLRELLGHGEPAFLDVGTRIVELDRVVVAVDGDHHGDGARVVGHAGALVEPLGRLLRHGTLADEERHQHDEDTEHPTPLCHGELSPALGRTGGSTLSQNLAFVNAFVRLRALC